MVRVAIHQIVLHLQQEQDFLNFSKRPDRLSSLLSLQFPSYIPFHHVQLQKILILTDAAFDVQVTANSDKFYKKTNQMH